FRSMPMLFARNDVFWIVTDDSVADTFAAGWICRPSANWLENTLLSMFMLLTVALRISKLNSLFNCEAVETLPDRFHVDVPLPMPTPTLSCGVGPTVEFVMVIVPLTAVPVVKSPISIPRSPATPLLSVTYEFASVKPLMLLTLMPSVPLLRTYIRV